MIATSVRRAALAICAVLMACGGTDAPPEVDGYWLGSPRLAPPRTSVDMSFYLTQNGTDVTGQGSFCAACGDLSESTGTFDVVGSNNGGSVVLVLSGAGGTNFNANYVAILEGSSTLRGSLTGSGFANDSLILRRERA